jgi:hypothetical protein
MVPTAEIMNFKQVFRQGILTGKFHGYHIVYGPETVTSEGPLGVVAEKKIDKCFCQVSIAVFIDIFIDQGNRVFDQDGCLRYNKGEIFPLFLP